MNLAGFALLAAGWAIVVAALFLLPPAASRAAFVLAGIAVQALGLVLTLRAHRAREVERG
jgi:hypothetical protein